VSKKEDDPYLINIIQRITRVEERVSGLDKSFESVQKRFDKLDERVSALEKIVETIKKRLDAARARSEEFIALMSDKAEYAVFLTPEGECNGLYVSKKEFYGFEVRELNNGKSNIHFSWHVKAIRIGDEETPVLEEPTPQFTDQEKDKQLEWTKNRQEADKKKEEDRLNRMKQKIAKYREATGKTSPAPHA
jgi:chromosome segregation ATPase